MVRIKMPAAVEGGQSPRCAAMSNGPNRPPAIVDLPESGAGTGDRLPRKMLSCLEPEQRTMRENGTKWYCHCVLDEWRFVIFNFFKFLISFF